MKAGLFALGADLLSLPAGADEKKPAGGFSVIGHGEILKGLDGMSRAAEKGHDPFAHGHNAAAVMSAAFFCREQKIGRETQKSILAVMKDRLLTSRIYKARPEEKAEPGLVSVSANGGTPEVLTKLDAGSRDKTHRALLGPALPIEFGAADQQVDRQPAKRE